MYFDGRAMALQFALLRVFLKHNPQLRDEILKDAKHFEDMYFYANNEVLRAMQDAYSEIINERP